MLKNSVETKKQSSTPKLPKLAPEITKELQRHKITCPITHLIFKEPVLLLPDVTNSSWNEKNIPATIEKEAYYSMINSTDKFCPLTRLPITHFEENLEIELLVKAYLSTYPEEKDQQYELTNTSTQACQPTITIQEDIETGTSILRPHANLTSRPIHSHTLYPIQYEEINTTNERQHQNVDEPQLTPMTRYLSFTPPSKEIITTITQFTLKNTFFITSNMLGAFAFEHDVYNVALAATVGSITLTTGGSLCYLWANHARLSLEQTLLKIIGGLIGTCAPVPISGLIGQLILHGKADADINPSTYVGISFYGCLLSLTALATLIMGLIVLVVLDNCLAQFKACCFDPIYIDFSRITDNVVARFFVAGTPLNKTTTTMINFTLRNAFFITSNMLGAFALEHDVYNVALAATVGSTTLTTGGSLFYLWANYASPSLDKAMLERIGGLLKTCAPVAISSLIGQLILHGKADADINYSTYVDISFLGCFISLVVLISLVGFILLTPSLPCNEYCCELISKHNSTSTHNSVASSSVAITPYHYERRSEPPNTTHANPYRFGFSENASRASAVYPCELAGARNC